jgi:cytochrome d ubiquinol oxidase subunit I
MVAVGSTISAFWIIVANSWQQTPAGYVFQNGRAELTNFYDAVFNPSTMVRFLHTVDAALITGAFLVAGIAAYLLLKNKGGDVARRALKVSVVFGLVASLLELFPLGHFHAVQVAETQPEKLAAIEGLIDGKTTAPMVAFGIPSEDPLSLDMAIEIPIPGALSWLSFGDTDAYVKGLNDFPPDERPPFFLTFVSFHTMVALGSFFIVAMLLGVFLLWRKKLFETKWFLKLLILSIPLPVVACELGWIAAEVGRQPWAVYRLLRTADAVSLTVSAEEILFSIIMFSVIYIFLGALYLFLMMKEVNHGPEAALAKEVTA